MPPTTRTLAVLSGNWSAKPLLPTARRCISVLLLAALVASTPPSWSQRLAPEEIKAHLGPATEDILRRNVDPVAREKVRLAVRQAFQTDNNDIWHARPASNMLAERLKKQQFGLERDPKGLIILRPLAEESKSVPDASLRTSRDLVDKIASEIRSQSILEHIGPSTHTELNRSQLSERLRIQMRVADYEQVTNSFDPGSPMKAVTLQKPITLLRLHGGDTKATGRYFFCCMWNFDINLRFKGVGWSDASGLATPPNNLLNQLAVTTIPAGTTVIMGRVADNFADEAGHPKLGGNVQIFVPHVPGTAFPYHQYKLKDGSLPSDIIVQSDDTVLRFRQ